MELRKINHVILHSDPHPHRTLVQQADNDERLIALWLHGRSKHTQRYYYSDTKRFFEFANKPLKSIILVDLQDFADSLDEQNLAPGSKRRILASIKSLISFAHKLGYLPFDTSRPLILPNSKDTLSERILSEAEVQKIIGMEINPRNQLLMRVLYAGGIRVSELCRLVWKDLQERKDAGQMTIFGKGQKTNIVLIPNPLWNDLMYFRNNVLESAPLFKSRKGGHLHPSQILRIVKTAAKRAGITKAVSPHWFRHAHASHAIAHGADLSLIQATLNHSSIATTGKYLHARPNDCSSRYLTV